MNRFSVIIPTFNRLDLLSRTLDSLFRQTRPIHEILVVDDGSTDGTAEYLASLKGSVVGLHQSNQGPGSARNVAAKQATGDYLAFLDSDDVWFPWTLAAYEAVAARHAAPAFIAGKPFRFKLESEMESVRDEVPQGIPFTDYLASGDEWRWWGASSFVVRRSAFNVAGGFTAQWINGEDADLALRLGTAAGFVQVSSPHTFGYREHAISAMKNFGRTLAGVQHAIKTELMNGYPGGPNRRLERLRILTRHIRPVSLDCIKYGKGRDAWDLYRKTLPWNLALHRWKYLVGFVLRAIF